LNVPAYYNDVLVGKLSKTTKSFSVRKAGDHDTETVTG
jgi:hypothetical protein